MKSSHMLFGLCLLSLVSGAVVPAITDRRCNEGEYMDGDFDDETQRFKPGAKCKGCGTGTYNLATNHTSIYCADCRHVCDGRGQIETQECHPTQNRVCSCDKSQGFVNADSSRPNSYLVCVTGNHDNHTPSPAIEDVTPKPTKPKRQPGADDDSMEMREEDEENIPANDNTKPLLNTTHAYIDMPISNNGDGGANNEIKVIHGLIALVVFLTILLLISCYFCCRPHQTIQFRTWFDTKWKERFGQGERVPTEDPPVPGILSIDLGDDTLSSPLVANGSIPSGGQGPGALNPDRHAGDWGDTDSGPPRSSVSSAAVQDLPPSVHPGLSPRVNPAASETGQSNGTIPNGGTGSNVAAPVHPPSSMSSMSFPTLPSEQSDRSSRVNAAASLAVASVAGQDTEMCDGLALRSDHSLSRPRGNVSATLAESQPGLQLDSVRRDSSDSTLLPGGSVLREVEAVTESAAGDTELDAADDDKTQVKRLPPT